MKMPSAVIFDFDGVIVESEQEKFKVLNKLLKPYKLSIKKKDFSKMVGKKTPAFLKEYFGNKLNEEEMKNIEDERREWIIKNIEKTKPVKGVKDFIKFLKDKGIKLCIATGTRRPIVIKILEVFGLAGTFDEYVTGEDFTTSKPDPEVYRIAIQRMNMPVENLLAIEDSAAGVSSAKGAGIKCVAITTTQRKSELKEADIVVKSFSELRKILVD